uniref:Uncharacterized protein n=1 Tax=Timema poppense TaxID=170557 RepID=A0A7R9D3M1_TIMPO|nr:unnamed protein product [Timema poppensis]
MAIGLFVKTTSHPLTANVGTIIAINGDHLVDIVRLRADTINHIQQSRGYENTRRTSSEGGVCNKHWHLDVWLAGSVAGFVQLSLACPVDLVKIKLQTQTGKTWGNNPELGYRGPLECLSSTYRDYGVRGLYRGLPVMMWR